MKYLIYFLMISALAILIYTATFLDLDHLLTGESGTAVICILGSLCVLVLLSILWVSRRIKQKSDNLNG